MDDNLPKVLSRARPSKKLDLLHQHIVLIDLTLRHAQDERYSGEPMMYDWYQSYGGIKELLHRVAPSHSTQILQVSSRVWSGGGRWGYSGW